MRSALRRGMAANLRIGWLVLEIMSWMSFLDGIGTGGSSSATASRRRCFRLGAAGRRRSSAALAEPDGPDLRRVSDSKGEKAGCRWAAWTRRPIRRARLRCWRRCAVARAAVVAAAAKARAGGQQRARNERGALEPLRGLSCAAGKLTHQLLQREEALGVDQLQQAEFEVEALLLAVVEVVEGAEHDLQEARELFFG